MTGYKEYVSSNQTLSDYLSALPASIDEQVKTDEWVSLLLASLKVSTPSDPRRADLLAGAGLGLALVAAGVLAPLGVGVLGMVTVAALTGVAAGLVSGLLGWGIIKATESIAANTPITNSSEGDADYLEPDSLAIIGSALGCKVGPSSELPFQSKSNSVCVQGTGLFAPFAAQASSPDSSHFELSRPGSSMSH
ncbi:MAG: hypothetical protein P4L79_03780 [Legionella sp.]|uniref:hypothetical protein n=1 Tax=Legionella sp. TaxID=459 RepID=UPI002845A920|nr:hypothetical protein [Legionella sp.]